MYWIILWFRKVARFTLLAVPFADAFSGRAFANPDGNRLSKCGEKINSGLHRCHLLVLEDHSLWSVICRCAKALNPSRLSFASHLRNARIFISCSHRHWNRFGGPAHFLGYSMQQGGNSNEYRYDATRGAMLHYRWCSTRLPV